MAETADGRRIDFSRIPGKDDRTLDMAYMTGMSDGWYAVLNEDLGLGWAVSYPVDVFPIPMVLEESRRGMGISVVWTLLQRRVGAVHQLS